MSARFQIKYQGSVIGEATLDELRLQVDRGELTPLHKLSPDGQQWRYASEFPQLFEDSFALDRNAPSSIDDHQESQRQPNASEVEWFAMIGDEQYGPWRYEEVVEYVRSDRLSPSDVVWHAGLDTWTAIELVLPREAKRYAQRRSQEASMRQKEERKRQKQERRRRRPVIPPEEQSRSVLAVASVVLSILWIVGLGSTAGIIIGILALVDIRAAKGYRTGVGLAILGIFIGAAGIGILMFFIVVNS